jgi:hypothetical protein
MHHRELLGPLCTAAWQTVRELMAVAAGEEQGLRPGMVAVVQTFGDQLNLHPHVHALVTRGGFRASGEWVLVPYVSSSAAEQPRPDAAEIRLMLLEKRPETATGTP